MKSFFLCLIFISILLFSVPLMGQQLTVDPSPGKKEETSFKVRFLRSVLVGFNSIGHLTLTGSGLISLRYSARKGSVTEFDVFSSASPLFLKNNDQLNAASHLLNPVGGLANASLRFSYPLKVKENKVSKIALRTGLKLIEAFPIKAIDGNYFLDQYLELGWSFQNLITENPMDNESLYFLAYPHLFVHHSDSERRNSFFGTNLPPTALGYGFEVGLNYNKRLHLSLTGSQFVNADSVDLQKFVVAIGVAFQF